MQNNDTQAEGKDSAQTESKSALRGAACSSVFIVQERYQDHDEAVWFDDPDQPPHTEKSFDQAKQWMISDIEQSPGHNGTYDHRIIERRESILFQTNSQMKTSATYEWVAEKIDQHGDIEESSSWATRAEALAMREYGFEAIALVRRVHCTIDGDEIERQYAYLIDDDVLPDFFDGGASVPKRFFNY